jgi:hypothetical protein
MVNQCQSPASISARQGASQASNAASRLALRIGDTQSGTARPCPRISATPQDAGLATQVGRGLERREAAVLLTVNGMSQRKAVSFEAGDAG